MAKIRKPIEENKIPNIKSGTLLYCKTNKVNPKTNNNNPKMINKLYILHLHKPYIHQKDVYAF